MSKKKKAIPKTIAGVKVPKDLRKAGNALIEKAQSPQGREVLAAGLAMAATAATAAMARAKTPAPPPPPETPSAPPPPPPPPPQGTQTAPDAQAIADALTGAAEQVLGRLFGKRAS